MKTNYLLPHRFKWIGLVLFIPMAVTALSYLIWPLWEADMGFNLSSQGLWVAFRKLTTGKYMAAAVMFLLLASLLMLSFSKEKDEDEFTSVMRCNSLIWATIVNFAVVILCLIFFSDVLSLYVSFLNLYLLLLLFVVRFNLTVMLHRKAV